MHHIRLHRLSEQSWFCDLGALRIDLLALQNGTWGISSSRLQRDGSWFRIAMTMLEIETFSGLENEEFIRLNPAVIEQFSTLDPEGLEIFLRSEISDPETGMVLKHEGSRQDLLRNLPIFRTEWADIAPFVVPLLDLSDGSLWHLLKKKDPAALQDLMVYPTWMALQKSPLIGAPDWFFLRGVSGRLLGALVIFENQMGPGPQAVSLALQDKSGHRIEEIYEGRAVVWFPAFSDMPPAQKRMDPLLRHYGYSMAGHHGHGLLLREYDLDLAYSLRPQRRALT